MTLSELDVRVSSAEFTEWLAFYQLEDQRTEGGE